MLSVGVDFGTSNSSAAVYDARSIRLLPLDHEAADPCVMRSLVYIERSGTVWFCQTALSRYLEQNTGRAVDYERQRVGEQHLALVRRLKHEFDRPEQLAALETLVEKNYGVAFFQAVEGAKVRLSDQHETEVRFVNADLRLRQPLTRAAFEEAIGPQVRSAHESVELAVSAAGVAPDAIDLVLTTGGSSRIPAFRRTLSDALPRARLQESDLFTSAASGMALSGALQTGGEINEDVPSCS